MKYINFILIFALISSLCYSCKSGDVHKNINSQSACETSKGYWYKGKCWKDFEEEGISVADIDRVVAEQMVLIQQAKLNFDGTSYPIDFLDMSPDGDEAVFIIKFRDELHHLIIIAPLDIIIEEKLGVSKVKAIFYVGNLDNQDFNEENIKAVGEVSLQVTGEHEFNIKGDLVNSETQKAMPLDLSINEALTGAGNTTVSLKENEAHLSGVLGTISYHQIKQLLTQHPEIKTLVLVDVPGSMNDAVNMHTGRLIHEAQLTTKVLANSEIASGGVDLFCAGTQRIVHKGAKLGIHSWCCVEDKTAAEIPKDHPAHQYQIAYFTMALGKEKGPSFYFRTLEAAPFDGVHFMSDEAIKSWTVATDFID